MVNKVTAYASRSCRTTVRFHGFSGLATILLASFDLPQHELTMRLSQEPAYHYELGRELKGLRQKGVLIVGSGNMVHNLRKIVWQDTAYDWALEFDAKMKQLILAGDHNSIMFQSGRRRAPRHRSPCR
jgi:4,5-DOPA dioxygenase extradiol